jgi:hypothetical protein
MNLTTDQNGKVIVFDKDGKKVLFDHAIDAVESLRSVDDEGVARYVQPLKEELEADDISAE